MKYDWSKVPDDVESIATDANGRVRGFCSHNPYPVFNKKAPERGEWSSSYCYYVLKNQKPFNGDWKDSLELKNHTAN